jgi:hypothetical protein
VKSFRHHLPRAGPIVALVFGESPSGQTRLFSLGADGGLAEWQLGPLSPGGGLCLIGLHDVAPPGAGMPTAMCFAPPMPYWARASTETLLLIAGEWGACGAEETAFAAMLLLPATPACTAGFVPCNHSASMPRALKTAPADDGYKVRAYNPDSCTARATFLGPTHGGPIARLMPFRSVASGGSWLAYATVDQVVGLIAWPLVGDPELSMGVIAHPGRVAAVGVSFNGRKLLTAGAAACMGLMQAGEGSISLCSGSKLAPCLGERGRQRARRTRCAASVLLWPQSPCSLQLKPCPLQSARPHHGQARAGW